MIPAIPVTPDAEPAARQAAFRVVEGGPRRTRRQQAAYERLMARPRGSWAAVVALLDLELKRISLAVTFARLSVPLGHPRWEQERRRRAGERLAEGRPLLEEALSVPLDRPATRDAMQALLKTVRGEWLIESYGSAAVRRLEAGLKRAVDLAAHPKPYLAYPAPRKVIRRLSATNGGDWPTAS